MMQTLLLKCSRFFLQFESSLLEAANSATVQEIQSFQRWKCGNTIPGLPPQSVPAPSLCLAPRELRLVWPRQVGTRVHALGHALQEGRKAPGSKDDGLLALHAARLSYFAAGHAEADHAGRPGHASVRWACMVQYATALHAAGMLGTRARACKSGHADAHLVGLVLR